MSNRKFATLSAGILAALLFAASIAHAGPARNARERQLARGVEQITHAYHQETGEALPVNQTTLAAVMEAIGATPNEAAFVYDRMQAYSQATEAIDQADRTIDRMQDFLGCLNTQGTGCVP